MPRKITASKTKTDASTLWGDPFSDLKKILVRTLMRDDQSLGRSTETESESESGGSSDSAPANSRPPLLPVLPLIQIIAQYAVSVTLQLTTIASASQFVGPSNSFTTQMDAPTALTTSPEGETLLTTTFHGSVLRIYTESDKIDQSMCLNERDSFCHFFVCLPVPVLVRRV